MKPVFLRDCPRKQRYVSTQVNNSKLGLHAKVSTFGKVRELLTEIDIRNCNYVPMLTIEAITIT